MLLVCLGQATRVAEYLMAGDKSYRASIRLGTPPTPTMPTGRSRRPRAVPDLNAADLTAALAEFTGDIQQVAAGLFGHQAGRRAALPAGAPGRGSQVRTPAR